MPVTAAPWLSPYPVLTDSPDVPRDIKALSDRLQITLSNSWVCTAATRPAHAAGRQIFETDTLTSYMSDGTTWRALSVAGPWIAYTPTWRNGVGGTGLSIGNGTLIGAYQQATPGKTVNFRIQLIRGSTSNVGTVGYSWTLPVTQKAGVRTTGSSYVWDSSAGAPVGGGSWVCYNDNEIMVNLGGSNLSSSGFGGTAWAVNDEIIIAGTYEAA